MGHLKQSFASDTASRDRERAAQDQENTALGRVIEALDDLPEAQQRKIVTDLARRLGMQTSTYDPYERGGPGDR